MDEPSVVVEMEDDFDLEADFDPSEIDWSDVEGEDEEDEAVTKNGVVVVVGSSCEEEDSEDRAADTVGNWWNAWSTIIVGGIHPFFYPSIPSSKRIDSISYLWCSKNSDDAVLHFLG